MILTKQNGPLATITINRPEVLNSISNELVYELIKAFRNISSDPNIRIIVITGAGDKAFVGGVDLHTLAKLDIKTGERFISDLHNFFLEIRKSEKIVIASINGYTLGGGLEMVAACDLRIASDRSRFGMPEVKVGLPSVIEAAYLPKLIGLGRAQEIIYLGEMISADEAEKIGLVNKVVPHERLREETLKMAEKILSNGPTAITLQKKLIAKWMELPLSAAIEAGIKVFAETFKTQEPEEGCRAFLEKRQPSYAIKLNR